MTMFRRLGRVHVGSIRESREKLWQTKEERKEETDYEIKKKERERSPIKRNDTAMVH